MIENKLEKVEIDALKKMSDSRNISDLLLKAFCEENGKFYNFYKFAKEEKDLIICFRGNSNSIIIFCYF